jgi:hypothetical protein
LKLLSNAASIPDEKRRLHYTIQQQVQIVYQRNLCCFW